MDQLHTQKGPVAHVSTLNRTSDTSFTLVPFAIAVLVLTVIGSLTVLIKFTSLASQEEQMTQALAEVQSQYNSMADVATKVNDIAYLVNTLETAYAAQVPFGEVLDMLEKTSYIAAKYEMVAIEKSGKVDLSGGVSRYSNFASLIKALKDTVESDGITTDVEINSVGQSLFTESVEGGTQNGIVTKFAISFNVKADLFAKPSLFGGYLGSSDTAIQTEPAAQTGPATQQTEPTTQEEPVPSENTPVESDLTTIFNEAADGPPAENTSL